MKVFIKKFLYTLVLGFAGFGLYSGWAAAKDIIGKNLVEKAEVEQKLSPVKPEFAHNHPVYSMHIREKEEFTFFDTLIAPSMDNMVGLKDLSLSSNSSKHDTPQAEPAIQMPVTLKQSKIKPRIVRVTNSHASLPLSLPMKQVKSIGTEGGRFTVQVSSFRDKKYAEALITKLRLKGYQAFIKSIQLPNGKTWYRVNIGMYPDHDSAQISAMKVQMKETFKTMVIAFSG